MSWIARTRACPGRCSTLDALARAVFTHTHTHSQQGFLGLACEGASQTISRASDGTYRLDNSIDFDGGYLRVRRAAAAASVVGAGSRRLVLTERGRGLHGRFRFGRRNRVGFRVARPHSSRQASWALWVYRPPSRLGSYPPLFPPPAASPAALSQPRPNYPTPETPRQVGSTCEPSAIGNKVNFRFESCEAKWKDVKVPLPPVGAGWFEVMYIDDEIRCCRDSRGDLQVCTRRK